MSEREFHCHVARVYLAEAARRRHQNFYWLVFGWAQNARRRAAASHREPKQEGLFA